MEFINLRKTIGRKVRACPFEVEHVSRSMDLSTFYSLTVDQHKTRHSLHQPTLSSPGSTTSLTLLLKASSPFAPKPLSSASCMRTLHLDLNIFQSFDEKSPLIYMHWCFFLSRNTTFNPHSPCNSHSPCISQGSPQHYTQLHHALPQAQISGILSICPGQSHHAVSQAALQPSKENGDFSPHSLVQWQA